ncbi:MAG: glycerol-3-phosphate acyltransferase, partial [Caldiserica bacterium]|nr:glycerol-3-phosphate acyltransferase [Caldisericota bacterium]
MLDKYLTIILPILIGYLLGSFLPAYFITKWVRNIDIRMVGDGNPGTANVKRNVGTSAAILTGFYDVTKGLLAMAIASTLFHSSLLFVNLSGLAAVCGHKFPFYLQFKGGRGIAAAVGIFLFTIARVSIINFTFKDILVTSAYIVTYALCVHFATHNDDFFTVTMLSIIAAILIFKVKFFGDLILLLALISFIFIEAVRNLKNLKMFRLSSEELPL